ncbi:MAG TPA: YbdD/YjiX family protein [Gemmatimonadaceae bacterium]
MKIGLQSRELPAASCQQPAGYRLRQLARGARAVIVRVLGVPDYAHYVAHMRAAHPHAVPLTAEQFARERMELRYSRPGAKCC